MLYKKLNLPINLPLENDEEIEVNEVENNIIIKLRNVSNINIDATIRLLITLLLGSPIQQICNFDIGFFLISSIVNISDNTCAG